MTWTHADLFAGIGGFAIAAERVGWHTLWASEIEPFARDWYHALFPRVTQYGDIRELRGADLPYVDVMTGGFPCQDLSTANSKGKGLDGPRSGLWREFARLIRECRPRWVVVENVGRLLTFGASGSYRVVTGDLRDAGYAVCRPVLMSAAALGAPHRRTRLWIMAHRNESGSQGRGTVSEVAGGCITKTETSATRRAMGDPTDGGQRGDGGTSGLLRLDAEPGANVDDTNGRGQEASGASGTGRNQESRQANHSPAFASGSGFVADAEGHLRRASRDDGRCAPDGTGFGFWDDAVPVRGADGTVRLVPPQVAEALTLAGVHSLVDGVPAGLVPDWGASPEGPERHPRNLRERIADGARLFPVAFRVPNRIGMLRGAGNAIIPQAAEVVFRAIIEVTERGGTAREET